MAPRKQRSVGRPLALLLLVTVGLYALIITKGWEPRLGLDLRGGSSVILTPEEGKQQPSTSAIDKAVDIIRQRVNGTGVAESEVVREGRNVVVSLPDVGREQALELVGRTARLTFRPVLQGPINGDPDAPVPTESPEPSPSASASVTPKSTPSATASAAVVKPPTATPTAAKRAVPAHLLAQAATPTPTKSPTATARPSTPAPPAPSPSGLDPQQQAALIETFQLLDCTDEEERARIAAVDIPEDPIISCSRDGELKYLLGPAEATGDVISDANATVDPQTNQWSIAFETTDSGSKIMGQITTELQGQPMAIVLDGILQSAPTVQSKIDDRGEITGDFTQSEAEDLATVLRYGALPVTFVPSEVLNISPTLGEESLDGGLQAGLLGISLVAIYILAYYRGLGLITLLGLGVFGALNYALVVILGNWEEVGFTLTLPGIAGLIISIGISADSYVVFYERIKDEVKAGRTLRLAVDRAYASAWRTILAADIVSFIAAAALYALSVGAVRGFAFTLGMATLLDIVMSRFFARPFVTLLARTRLLQTSKALGLRGEPALTPKEA